MDSRIALRFLVLPSRTPVSRIPSSDFDIARRSPKNSRRVPGKNSRWVPGSPSPCIESTPVSALYLASMPSPVSVKPLVSFSPSTNATSAPSSGCWRYCADVWDWHQSGWRVCEPSRV
jgi:hypothetical protein